MPRRRYQFYPFIEADRLGVDPGLLRQFTDEQGRGTLADYLDAPGFRAAGRLDYDSEGLLLLTDDGVLQQQIANPRHKLWKTYLVQVEGTPLHDKMHGEKKLDWTEFVRTIAVARILMPASHVRLSAGRESMNEQMHALAYFAGANSIFYGEKLLTTPNPESNSDMALFARLGITPEQRQIEQAPETPNPRFYDAASPVGTPATAREGH